MLKTVITAVCGLAILAGSVSTVFADGSCPASKEKGCAKKCCQEAKKAGKDCEKCTKTEEKK